jgi:hypothetical protein
MLFPFEEIVPLGGASGRDIIEMVKQRYAFLNAPDLSTAREEFLKNGYQFQSGEIEHDGVKANILDFSVYTDGIVVSAATTETAEFFLDSVIRLMQTEFSFRDFSTPPQRYFLSNLVVEFDRPLGNLLSQFETISNVISKRIAQTYKIDVPMNLARIDFEIDKTVIKQTIARFSVERRFGIPFDKERYFSGAPLRTSDHISLLEQIEKTID